MYIITINFIRLCLLIFVSDKCNVIQCYNILCQINVNYIILLLQQQQYNLSLDILLSFHFFQLCKIETM